MPTKNDLVRFNGNLISIMGLKGMPDDGGIDWIIDIPMTEKDYILVQVSPSEPTVLSGIENVIESDRAEGKEDMIDHVLISNRYAVCLFLEGKLTADVLANAKVENDDLVVSMRLAGQDRKVVIRDEHKMKYHCATIDAQGKVV